MQELYRCSFKIETDEHSAYQNIRYEIVKWARNGRGRPISLEDEPRGRRSYEDGYSISWEEFDANDRDEQGFRLVHELPEDASSHRRWKTTVEVVNKHVVEVAVRVARESTLLRLAPPPPSRLRRPNIVKTLLSDYRCMAGPIRLSARPSSVPVGLAPEFRDQILLDRARALPVVVLSQTDPEFFLFSPRKVADELAGLAHVAYLTRHDEWAAYRDALGDDFVPFGGARIYWPGYGGDESLWHRYWTRNALARDGFPIHHILLKILARLSVESVPDLRRISALESEYLASRLQTGNSQSDSDALLDAMQQMIDQARQIEDLKERNRVLENENRNHAENYRTLLETAGAPDQEEKRVVDTQPESVPTSWSEFVDCLPNLETSAFVITDNARKSASETGYLDPGRMWQHLQLLAQAAEEYSEKAGRLGVRLELWMSEQFGLNVALKDNSISKVADFEWDGASYNREPHVKVDDAKAPNECGRIYFAYESSDAHHRFIVDHIGTHL